MPTLADLTRGDKIDHDMPSTSRRTFLHAAGGASLLAGHASAQTPRRRNVVFILTDDHRYDAFGFMHPQPWLGTPQLDSLARDGVHFR